MAGSGRRRVTIVDASCIFYQYYGICSIFHRSHSSDPTAVWKTDLRGEWGKWAMCSETRSLLMGTRTVWRGTLAINTRTPAQPTGDFQTGSKTEFKEMPLECAMGSMREQGPPTFYRRAHGDPGMRWEKVRSRADQGQQWGHRPSGSPPQAWWQNMDTHTDAPPLGGVHGVSGWKVTARRSPCTVRVLCLSPTEVRST